MGDKRATGTVRVVKSAKCPSVSRRSTLGYDVGLSPEGDVCFRVSSNSAPGAFARAWIAWAGIKQAIASPAREKAITSAHLSRLCGGGQNTAGFVLAVLKHEGLVKTSTAKKRCHELVDDSTFLASVNAWDQAGKGTGSKAGVKGRTRAGAKTEKDAKGNSSPSLEGNPTDVAPAVPSFVAQGDLPVKAKGQRSTATKNGSPDAPKDDPRRATKKRA